MLIFLKLGGSVITDKDKPKCARLEKLNQIAKEIVAARKHFPELKILIGHGSGSFGHVSGKKYKTRNGVRSEEDWIGFSQVWKDARALNQIVIDSLTRYDLPVIAFPPSSGVISENRSILYWDTAPLKAALKANLIPIVNGDVIFDQAIGGTILSTEEIFTKLAADLYPQIILLAGIEKGIWSDYPQRTQLLKLIRERDLQKGQINLQGSGSTDTTGGMLEKVKSMFTILKDSPQTRIHIFSAENEGNVYQALCGESIGTILSKD